MIVLETESCTLQGKQKVYDKQNNFPFHNELEILMQLTLTLC